KVFDKTWGRRQTPLRPQPRSTRQNCYRRQRGIDSFREANQCKKPGVVLLVLASSCHAPPENTETRPSEGRRSSEPCNRSPDCVGWAQDEVSRRTDMACHLRRSALHALEAEVDFCRLGQDRSFGQGGRSCTTPCHPEPPT